MKRAALRFSALLLPVLLFLTVLPQPVRADVVTDTIGIYVGYYGWQESEYREKVTYHWTDLDDWYGGALDTQELIYSYYSGSRTYLVAARGFLIRELLQYAGIDFGSIASIDFFTKDHANGAYRSFTRYSLFDLPRYYFPNLAASEETGEIYPWDGDDIWNGAATVEAMLALEDYTEWDTVGSEFQARYDPALLSPNCRFHLFFCQTEPEEASTSSAAKYCYKIERSKKGWKNMKKTLSLLLMLALLVSLFAGMGVLAADETAALEVYTQEEGGEAKLAKAYTAEELAALAEKAEGYAYPYCKKDAWNATVATEYVTLSALLADAGVSFGEGDKLSFVCSDGPYSKGDFSYENISARGVDVEGNAVPTGLAITWNNGSLAESTVADIAATAKNSGSLRFVSGATAAEIEGQSAAGNRMPSGVVSITVVSAAKASAETVAPAPTYKTYTVKAGDTLWSIARRELGSGFRWGELFAVNDDLIKNPRMIYVGQVLSIPEK